MEKESLKTKFLLSKDNVTLNSSFFTFDLPSLIENMKQSHIWAEGELNSMILLKSSCKSVLLTAL